jgi:CO/xanthine dehydrogenase FAD-binding subunit
MRAFDYARAESTADALRLVAARPDAKFLGGGTNLVDLMRERIELPGTLIDVTGLSRDIEERPDGCILIGAGVRNTEVAAHRAVRERFPLLARAVLAGASGQIRNMATVGGNLMQRTRCYYFYDTAARCNKRTPGAGCDAIDGFNRIHAILGASPACIATHPSDMCVALVALDAVVHVEGTKGPRSLKLADFHRLPSDRPDDRLVAMSLLQKAAGAVLRLLPEKVDDLIEARRVVGQSISRVDGTLKVTGKARYAAEVPLANIAFASLVYSSIARGTIASIETAAAEAAPGVLLVMTHKNAPRLKPPLMMMADAKGAAASNLPVMQDAAIRWNGEPVACVIAESQEEADHAAALVRVAYATAPAQTSFAGAKAKAKAPDNILGEPSKIAVGDAEAALAKAPFRVDQTYTTPRHNHCAIELHAVTVAWEGDALVVHDASQMLHLTRSTLAAVFGLKEDKVRVRSASLAELLATRLSGATTFSQPRPRAWWAVLSASS